MSPTFLQYADVIYLGFVTAKRMPRCVRETLNLAIRAHERQVNCKAMKIEYLWLPFCDNDKGFIGGNGQAVAGVKYYMKRAAR